VCGIDKNINVKEIWLNYFNQVLFEKGIITEEERNKMKLEILKNVAHQRVRTMDKF